MLNLASRQLLLDTAFASIHHGLVRGERGSFVLDPPRSPSCARVYEPRSCFVTLTRDQELRGCCGMLEAERSLIEDVWHNSFAAAFMDPRFNPLEQAELPGLRVEISVLTALQRIPARTREDLLESLRPGRDGLVLQWRATRVTFIPHVWENIADPHTFVSQLMRKAGWPAQFWAPDLQAWRYEAESIG